MPLVVRATDGEHWRLSSQMLSWQDRLPIIGIAPRVRRLRWTGEGTAVAVLIDLVPTKAAPTFVEHLAEHRNTFVCEITIDSSRSLTATTGPLVVRHVVGQLRELAAAHSGEVHVFLRTPWAAAALLGALMNTLRVVLYEWDNSVTPPRYEKTITVAIRSVMSSASFSCAYCSATAGQRQTGTGQREKRVFATSGTSREAKRRWLS